MANPQAVMRAAQAAGPMGYDDAKDRPAGGETNAPAAPDGDGLGAMMNALQGVGEFLKSQGPGGQQAMGHFKALLQSMMQLGQEQPQPPAQGEPPAPRRIHESQAPGVQVL